MQIEPLLSHAWSLRCARSDAKEGELGRRWLTASHRSTLHEERWLQDTLFSH